MYILKGKMISIYHWYCVLNLPKRLFTFIKICCNCNWILAEKILIFIQKYGNTFQYLSQIVWFIESLGIAHCCQKRNFSFQNKLFQSITDFINTIILCMMCCCHPESFSAAIKGTLKIWIYLTMTSTFKSWESFSSIVNATELLLLWAVRNCVMFDCCVGS